MNNKYHFNEFEKRFESKEIVCKYCNSRTMGDPEEQYYASIYRVMNRSNIIIKRTVEYNEIKIGIPRCNDCFKIHEGGKARGGFYTIILSILALGIFHYLFGEAVVYALIFIPIILAAFLPMGIRENYAHKHNIPTEEAPTKDNEWIKSLLQEGWSTKRPEV